jgi:Membrane bound beta barrel domain (DUF5777)
MTNKFFGILLGALSLAGLKAQAQDDLMNELNSSLPPVKEYAFATFKSTRLIDGSSVECLGPGVLDFRISHRFGALSSGAQDFWGVDNAYTKLSLDYGVNRWLMLGIGHSAFNKDYDGSLKIKLIRQQIGAGSPVTVTYFGNATIETMPAPTLADSSYKWLTSNRLYYTHQLLIGRKFSKTFSMQIMPSVVHYNLVDSAKFSNNTYAIGIGFRKMFSRSSAITAEYFYRLNNSNLLVNGQPTYNTFSIGYEVETGGHVFQLMVTNAQGLNERNFIGQTTDQWAKHQLHIGFNISRVFTIVKPKGYEEDKDSKGSWGKGKDADDKAKESPKETATEEKKAPKKAESKNFKKREKTETDFKVNEKANSNW